MSGNSSQLEIRGPYTPYEASKIGVFRVETGEYDLHGAGWIQVEEDSLIIGESEDCYINRLLETSDSWWEGDKIVTTPNYLVPFGIHKSRFVRWKTTQLSLF